MEERGDKRGGWGCAIGLVLAMLVLLPLVYVLGVGPASWLHETGYLSPHAYFWLYDPIVGEELKPDWAAYVIEHYIALWNPAGPPSF